MDKQISGWTYNMNAGGWCMCVITGEWPRVVYHNFVLTRVRASELYMVGRPEMRAGGPGWYMVKDGPTSADVKVIGGPHKLLADAKRAGLEYANTVEG